MLSDSLQRSFDLANSMVTVARNNLSNKAAGAMDVITSSSTGGATRQSFSQAKEQYAALKNGWVWAAVRIISTRIAGQPIHVARMTKRMPSKGMVKSLGDMDGLEPLEQHPLLDLLADPNALMTAWSMMFSTVASLELTGRSLWWVTHDTERQIILPVPTHWIQDIDARRSVWKLRPAGSSTSIQVSGEEIVHFFYPDPSDPFGCLSPLAHISQAVCTDDAISDCQWRTFKQGMFPQYALRVGAKPSIPGAATTDRPILTPEQRGQLINAIKNIYHGVENYGEPLILDGLIEEAIKLSISPSELQFLDSARLSKARILQGYGASSILLGEVEGANRASATVADETFCSNKVNPLIHLLSLTLTEWLGPMFSNGGEKLVVWIEPAVPRDEDMRLKWYQAGANLGFIQQNEFRRAMRLPDVDGGDEPKQPATTPAKPGDTTKPNAEAVETEQDIQTAPEMTLNGAQIASASSIVQAVADGKISRDSGIGQLIVLLNLTEEQAERVMGSVGEGFEPTPTATAEKGNSLESMLDPLLNPYTLEQLDGRPTIKTVPAPARKGRKGPVR